MIWKKVYVILARVLVLNDNNILVTRTLLCGVRVNNTLSFVSTVLFSESHTDNFIFNFFLSCFPQNYFFLYILRILHYLELLQWSLMPLKAWEKLSKLKKKLLLNQQYDKVLGCMRVFFFNFVGVCSNRWWNKCT